MTHSGSDVKLITDAPKDHCGLGESFAPTDLLAASVGSCVLTIMGIEAEKRNWDIKGASVIVNKKMACNPRRIKTIKVTTWLPENLSRAQKYDLKRISEKCPVILSIKDAIDIEYEWINLP